MTEPPDYAALAPAPATSRALRGDWADFARYLAETGGEDTLPIPPEVVAAYLAAHARIHAHATLLRRLWAIRQTHRQHGLVLNTADPLIRDTLRGIARMHGSAPRQAAALATREVSAMIRGCPPNLTGARDAAILLVGYAGALRRSEIVSLDRADLTFQPEGMRLFLRRSKTDAAGQGAELVLPHGKQRQTCPVRAVQRWLEMSATEFGPVFRGIDRWGVIGAERLHPDSIRRIVTLAASRAGISVAAHEALSPHGLRAGFVTEAYRAGARPEDIMTHTRHASYATLRRYIRRSNKESDNPARLLGL